MARKLGFWDEKAASIWPEFFDPGCREPLGSPKRSDSAAKFEARYGKLPTAYPRPTALDAMLTRISALAIEEQYGVDFSVGDKVKLAFDLLVAAGSDKDVIRCIRDPQIKPRSRDMKFVVLELRQFNIVNEPGGAVPIDIDLEFRPIGGDGLYVSAADVHVQLPSGALPSGAQIEGQGARKSWPDGLLEVQSSNPRLGKIGLSVVVGGSSLEPIVQIETSKGPLGGITIRRAFAIQNMGTGTHVKALLVTDLSGLSLVTPVGRRK